MTWWTGGFNFRIGCRDDDYWTIGHATLTGARIEFILHQMKEHGRLW